VKEYHCRLLALGILETVRFPLSCRRGYRIDDAYEGLQVLYMHMKGSRSTLDSYSMLYFRTPAVKQTFGARCEINTAEQGSNQDMVKIQDQHVYKLLRLMNSPSKLLWRFYSFYEIFWFNPLRVFRKSPHLYIIISASVLSLSSC
jgi:hypothetical protein